MEILSKAPSVPTVGIINATATAIQVFFSYAVAGCSCGFSLQVGKFFF